MSNRYVIPSLDRAITVLEHLAREPDGLSLAELTERTEYPKSTLFRILSTLQERACITCDGERNRYRLGLKLWELGRAFLAQSDLYTAAVAYMKQLAETCGESVFLGVLDEGEVTYVRRMESPKSVMVVRKLEQRVPAYCTATGEAMMAFLPSRQVDKILDDHPLEPVNPKTVTDRKELYRRLEQIRRTKVAVVDGEYNPDLLCIASPVLDETHRPCAALTVALLSSQAGQERIQRISEHVRKAARGLSQDLGYVETVTA